MKFREFNLRDDITQGEYVVFRVDVEARKPKEWRSVETLPIEILYDILVHSAITGGWVEDVIETNEYDDKEAAWKWTNEFVEEIPAGQALLKTWAEPILDRWIEYKGIDPN